MKKKGVLWSNEFYRLKGMGLTSGFLDALQLAAGSFLRIKSKYGGVR